MCGHNVLRLLCCGSLLFAIGVPSPSIAQSSIQKQLDKLTVTTSLDRDGIQPWHMQLSFDLFDQDGKLQESGTVEEWWASSDRARLAIKSPSFNQALPGDDPAVRSREAYLVHLLLSEVMHPMPHISNPDSFVSTAAPHHFGQISLSCTSLSSKGSSTAVHQYCTDPGTGDLRVVSSNGVRSDALNTVGSAINTQVAMTHTIAYLGHVAIRGHIDSIEPFDPDHSNLQLGRLAPARDATLTPSRLLTQIPPIYPEAARESGRSGMVVLHMRILANGKHGAIDTIASTGTAFMAAALDAVNQWSYTPMKRNKVGVESDAVITIMFLPQDKNQEGALVQIMEDDSP